MVSFTASDPVFSVRRRTKSLLTLLSAVIGAYGKFILFYFDDVTTFFPSISLIRLAPRTNIWSLTSKLVSKCLQGVNWWLFTLSSKILAGWLSFSADRKTKPRLLTDFHAT